MSKHQLLPLDLHLEARNYFESKNIGQILESIVTGLTFTRPDDPLAYIEDCVHRIRMGEVPGGKNKIKWDIFIPPPAPVTNSGQRNKLSAKKPQKSVPPLRKKHTALPHTLPPMQPFNMPVVGGEKVLTRRETGTREEARSKSATQKAGENSDGCLPGMMTGAISNKPLPPIGGDIGQNSDGAVQSPLKSSGLAWDNIVFVLGGPGCGKGTQCARIAKDFNYTHLSAGDLLRAEVATGSELGKDLDLMMKEGRIVPMDVTIRLLREAMERAPPSSEGFLIDGFPRQLDQATAFENQIRPCKFVLYFECPEALLEKRLLKRGETSGRADDNLETIKKRFRTFIETSLPVIKEYEAKGKCVKISSEPPVDQVYSTVAKYFGKPSPLNHDNVVFVLGGPGSGKGTQCVRLAKEFNLTHLSTGDLLRGEVEKQSAVGKEAEGYIKEGRMVPMTLIMSLLRMAMEKNMDTSGFLIDGFPRTMAQAKEFEATIGPCRTVLFFNCALATLEARLIERGKSSGRADDNLETIRKRFKTFQNESVEVINLYKSHGKVVEISSEQSVEQVYQEARKVFVKSEPLNHPNITFVLGGPGSGKGTQCTRLARDYNLKHISTGDLLRREVENQTELGISAQRIMIQGGMVSMDLIMGLLVKEIKDNFDATGFLVDGFPRSLDQALEFERVVGLPRLVLYFYCPLSVLEARLLERGKTSGRADDTLDTIKQRFVTYEKESLPVVDYYRKSGRLVEISSVPPVSEVYEEARKCFEAGPSDVNGASTDAPGRQGTPKSLPFDGENLVFVLGGPGSGKGTQCAKLVEQLGWAHLSTGDLLREEVTKGTELGRRLEADMKEGKMVPLEVTMQLLLQAMEERRGAPGYLIDGFPRTMEQAELFEKTIGRCTFVLYFSAPHTVLAERLLKRGETSGRADDNAESIGKRLLTFEKTSMAVIEYFSKDGRVREVPSEGRVEEIFSRTIGLFESK